MKLSNKASNCEDVVSGNTFRHNAFVKGTRVLLAPLLILAMTMPVNASVYKTKPVVNVENTESSEEKNEIKNDITLDIIEAQGAVIRKVERGLKVLKVICANFKSNSKLSKEDIVLVDKLLVDYNLSQDGGVKDKLIRIFNYQDKQLDIYLDILVKLYVYTNLLNAVECEGCYEKGIKVYLGAIDKYKKKQQEVNKLKDGI